MNVTSSTTIDPNTGLKTRSRMSPGSAAISSGRMQSGDAIVIGGVRVLDQPVTDATDLVIAAAIKNASGVAFTHYPTQSNATMDFPRYALSDGVHLFIADGGNDRVMVYNTIPTSNGMPADAIIGELGGAINQASDSTDSMRTPLSLAWDGQNLYVADSFNVRVLVYTPAVPNVPYSGVRNAASLNVYAAGSVAIGGAIQAKDTVTITINGTDYKYTVLKTDTLDTVTTALANLINAANNSLGDPECARRGGHSYRYGHPVGESSRYGRQQL